MYFSLYSMPDKLYDYYILFIFFNCIYRYTSFLSVFTLISSVTYKVGRLDRYFTIFLIIIINKHQYKFSFGYY